MVAKVVNGKSKQLLAFNLYFWRMLTEMIKFKGDVLNIYASPGDFKAITHRDKIRGLYLLEYFVNHCHQIGLSCEAWIEKGDPKKVVCSEVKRVQPDMLVLGCHGLGPFQRYHNGLNFFDVLLTPSKAIMLA